MSFDTTKSLAMTGVASSIFVSGIFFASSQLMLPLLYPLPTDISTRTFTALFYSGARAIVPLVLVGASATGVAAYLDPSHR